MRRWRGGTDVANPTAEQVFGVADLLDDGFPDAMANSPALATAIDAHGWDARTACEAVRWAIHLDQQIVLALGLRRYQHLPDELAGITERLSGITEMLQKVRAA